MDNVDDGENAKFIFINATPPEIQQDKEQD